MGRLGRYLFPAGYYVYAGSALGGLAARIARHRRDEKRLHWHVDYLRARAEVVAAYASPGRQRRECALAQALAALPGARLPAARFGASDCRCLSHLVWLPSPPSPADLPPGFAAW